MSNYHYNDQVNKNLREGDYSTLEETTHYSCDQYCICRHTSNRSDKDKMYYDWFVLNKPIDIVKNGQYVINPNIYEQK